VRELLVTSRTYGRAVLAASAVGGKAAEWEEIVPRLSEVDIVVSCTAAPGFILDRTLVAEALRGRRGQPLFAIDIAVPRDIEPSVNELDNVYLYDIDGLQSVVEANVEERRKAAQQAHEEITRDVTAYLLWRRSLTITPTIVSLRDRLAEMGSHEVARFRRRFGELNDHQEQLLDDLVRGVIQKILHRPVVYLRKSVQRGDADTCTAIYQEIFGLADSPSPGKRRTDGRQDTETRVRSGSGPQGIVHGGKDE
jgi:glutamyl-tRNA reductase